MTQMPAKPSEMPKAYEHATVERRWYQHWLEKGYFKPIIDSAKKPFVIIMPPPNVTGELHLGHALTATIEDIMVRWHRMKGEPTLWLPGTDHSGISAQVVVERLIAKEGLTRHKLGREKFSERMWQWAEQCRKTIREQHQRLGVSADWSRECFTLDAGPSKAVRHAFVNLYNKGLIYRGERIINWCPRCTTAVSDLEVDHKDLTGNLWYVRYPLSDNPNEYITVATTRPETILGDTAVAVNPGDDRFKKLVGRQAVLPVLKRLIPIIADESVDLAFGTGAVKITPAHDPVDFEVAQRHHLPLINILNADATMNENAGPYKGMDRFECRKAILTDLEKDGLLVKTEPYAHAVGHCQRCQTLVEPIASRQWFVKMAPLAQPTIEVILNSKISILPERFTKVYLNWMENVRDWCISRQLWWGHRIPVWYCKDCGEVIASVTDVKSCPCGSHNVEQDPDVLDTWFSSGLWTHSTLGWPDDTPELRYFYPTSVMETAYDILFFWVARMIVMGLENMHEIPFHTVYLHGLIRDEKGEKMSKVKGNVLNPLDLMDKYGTDALRFAISTGTSPGNDSRMAPDRLEAGRNFANKLWNATRFVLGSLPPVDELKSILSAKAKSLPVEDRWIVSRLHRTIADVDRLMTEYQFGEAERLVYEFLWGDYCDWYLELSKIRLRSTEKDTISPIPTLISVLDVSLRLLHPFMPFITEELWQNLKLRLPEGCLKGDSIMLASYPEADESALDPDAERIMGTVIEIIRSIRNARSEYKVEAGKWIAAQVHAGELKSAVSPYASAIENLARVRPLTILAGRTQSRPGGNALVLVLEDSDVVIPMESMVDIEAEKQRIQQEMQQLQSEITRLETLLRNKSFVDKAPPEVVEKERAKLASYRDKLVRLQQQLG